MLPSLLLGAVGLLAPLGCSSGSSPSDSQSSAPGTVGAQCSANAPCATGLTCAQSGSLLGRCTADCSANLDLCASQFGSKTVCMNASQCALVCSTAADCPGQGAQCVGLTGGTSACITNPDNPGAPPPPNGACYNLGGAFGDTVANGGYRCTPSPTGMIGTGIDQCKDGKWVNAFTCTCEVTSSISGQQNPSECMDFEQPGTARCEYAVDYCEQCDPTAGCQAH